jgi:hypothetical protein
MTGLNSDQTDSGKRSGPFVVRYKLLASSSSTKRQLARSAPLCEVHLPAAEREEPAVGDSDAKGIGAMEVWMLQGLAPGVTAGAGSVKTTCSPMDRSGVRGEFSYEVRKRRIRRVLPLPASHLPQMFECGSC